jgi:cytochrome bd-type quinol oxidase subunit 2
MNKMNFIEKNVSVLRPGNLTLSLILVCTVLGLLGWSWVDFTSDPKTVNGNAGVLLDVGAQDLGTGLNYSGDQYKTIASMLTGIILVAMVVGIILSKINNEFIKNDTAEFIALFLFTLVGIIMMTLDIVPEESADADSEAENYRDHSYGITGIIFVSIVGGLLAGKSKMAHDFSFLGTTLYTTLLCVALGVISYAYWLTKVHNDDYDVTKRANATANGDFLRQLTNSEYYTMLSAVIICAIVVAIALFHMYLEKKSMGKFFKSSSPKRASPKRTTKRK